MSEHSFEEVAAATEELLRAIGAAQRGWIARRNIQGVGVTERIATFCALRALVNAFPIEAVTEDAHTIELLKKFADSIQLRLASAEELSVNRVTA